MSFVIRIKFLSLNACQIKNGFSVNTDHPNNSYKLDNQHQSTIIAELASCLKKDDRNSQICYYQPEPEVSLGVLNLKLDLQSATSASKISEQVDEISWGE